MQKIDRAKEISKIISNNDNIIGEIEIFWKNELESFPIYKVPLSILLYNPYNGRVASQVKSIEKHRNSNLDIHNENHQKIIEKFIWDSKVERNKKTLENIEERGQEKPATITKDGVLIDGNRRAMILNKLQKTYIKTIVLPVELDEDPISIQELEYEYQIAVDEKVDYNPIEKYIKANDLYNRYREAGVNENKILIDLARLNGFGKKNRHKVKELLNVYSLMSEYLKTIKADGFLVLLEKKEDLFLSLYSWVETFLNDNGSNRESKKGFEGYQEVDVMDLKMLSFDYIHAETEGKNFRTIAQGNRGSHLFSKKLLWSEFYENHIKTIRENYREYDLDSQSENYIEELKSKSLDFKNRYKSLFEENLEKYKNKLYKEKDDKLPFKKLDEINEVLTGHEIKRKLHTDIKIVEEVKEVAKNSISLISQKPLTQLESIKEMLFDIETDFLNDSDVEEFKNIISDINKILFELKKKL